MALCLEAADAGVADAASGEAPASDRLGRHQALLKLRSNSCRQLKDPGSLREGRVTSLGCAAMAGERRPGGGTAD